MKERKKKRGSQRCIYLEYDLDGDLIKYSKTTGLPMSYLVSRALKEFFAKYPDGVL
jgi:hypothetical protein